VVLPTQPLGGSTAPYCTAQTTGQFGPELPSVPHPGEYTRQIRTTIKDVMKTVQGIIKGRWEKSGAVEQAPEWLWSRG
jgi:hypothetical protein